MTTHSSVPDTAVASTDVEKLPSNMTSTSAMTAASAAASCVSSACKNGGQEDNGTELEFRHGNLERGPASYR